MTVVTSPTPTSYPAAMVTVRPPQVAAGCYQLAHPDGDVVLRVPRHSVETRLSVLLGRPVTELLDFGQGIDPHTDAGAALVRALRLVHAERAHPAGLAALPQAREQLEGYLVTLLLHAGRHQYSDALDSAERQRRLGRLAPVVAYIDDNADSELTPELLARVGCISVRTLHAAFADQLGESPMAYVRRVRLAKVRADLLRADPRETRVTDVAMRWGFFHQSRFAQQYRDHFHELPSVTLAGAGAAAGALLGPKGRDTPGPEGPFPRKPAPRTHRSLPGAERIGRLGTPS